MKQLYPSWRYHRTQAPVVIHSQEASDALGDGWCNNPGDADAHVDPAAVEAPTPPVMIDETERARTTKPKAASKKPATAGPLAAPAGES